MGSFIDDKEFLNDNISEFAKRVESQYSIFLEDTPTFCDYFTINKVVSKVDSGLQMVEKITGPLSATRYNLIKDFPIYGIQQMILSLVDEENGGFTTELEAEGKILPNTIKPLPDDYFSVTYLEKCFTFRVTEIAYDNIKSNNFYKISFELKSVDISYYDNFMKNTVETYKTIFRNYGTEDKFIITEDTFLKIQSLDKVYTYVRQYYMDLFYVQKYNCLLFQLDTTTLLADIYTNHFCNKNKIFVEKSESLDNKYFYTETDTAFPFCYNTRTIQSMIEKHDLDMITDELHSYYSLVPTFNDSIFKYYGDYRVKNINVELKEDGGYGEKLNRIVPLELIENIVNKTYDSEDIYTNLISLYLNEDMKKYDLELNKVKRFKIDYSLKHFVLIPLFMFTMKRFYDYLVKKG